MDSRNSHPREEVDYDFLPFLRVYKDGRVERFFDTETLPSATDPLTGVASRDVTIIPGTDVYVRIYLPPLTGAAFTTNRELPLLVYFHGGAFFLSSASSTRYHHYLNSLVAESRVIAVSVNYRKPPEHPLPIAYEDSLFALRWVASHRKGDGPDEWLNNHADFGSVFLSGESAGANIAHNLAMEAGKVGSNLGVEILGMALVHPFFWGSDPIGSESENPERKALVDRVWPFACPSNPDNDDPRLNPVVEGAPSLVGLGCRRVKVCVAEKDILRERGWEYYRVLGRSGWKGVVEIYETRGEDHGFHLFDLTSEKARDLVKNLAEFFNGRKTAASLPA